MNAIKVLSLHPWQRRHQHSTIRPWLDFCFQKVSWIFFDVTNVEEEHTGEYAETGSEKLKLHIYLDERDTRSEEWHDLKPNGFTESREVTDFPIRDRKVILHVRRRRWTDSEGHNVVIDRYDLVAEGTSYSKEFADVLKKIYGYVPRHGMFRGADL